MLSPARIERAPFYRARSASTESVHVALLPSLLAPLLRCFSLTVHVFPDPENPCDRPEPTQHERDKCPTPWRFVQAIGHHTHHRRPYQNGRHQPIIHVQPQKTLHSCSSLFPSPKGRIWKLARGWWGRPLRSLSHRLVSTLLDTPLQSSLNPSETDPYPSTPSSSGPRSGRYRAKSHPPGSAGYCAAQTPI